MTYRSRAHPLWYAYMLHRISGLLLALFLPAHFYMLSLALDAAALDAALEWTRHPLTKIAEFGLVFLLAAHFFGGLRLLALEWLPWTPRHKTLAAGAVAASFLVSATFFLQAI